jgi:hypothetical protein
MKLTPALFLNLLLLSAAGSICADAQAATNKKKKNAKHKKTATNEAKRISRGLCVIGCTPYVNPYDDAQGILKYEALVKDMSENCDIMVHVGDTKAGAAVCNSDLMVSWLVIEL